MSAEITLPGVTFLGNMILHAPAKPVIVKHRFTDDTDVPANYRTDRTDAIINVDGSFRGGPIIIGGLLYGKSYTILIIIPCDKCGGFKKVIFIDSIITHAFFHVEHGVPIIHARLIPLPTVMGTEVQKIITPTLDAGDTGMVYNVDSDLINIKVVVDILPFCPEDYSLTYVTPDDFTIDNIAKDDVNRLWIVTGHYDGKVDKDFLFAAPVYVQVVTWNGVNLDHEFTDLLTPGTFWEMNNLDSIYNFGYSGHVKYFVQLRFNRVPLPVPTNGSFAADYDVPDGVTILSAVFVPGSSGDPITPAYYIVTIEVSQLTNHIFNFTLKPSIF